MKNYFDIQNYDTTVTRLGPPLREPVLSKAEEKAEEKAAAMLAFEKGGRQARPVTALNHIFKSPYGGEAELTFWERREKGLSPEDNARYDLISKADFAIFTALPAGRYLPLIGSRFGVHHVLDLRPSQTDAYVEWAEALLGEQRKAQAAEAQKQEPSYDNGVPSCYNDVPSYADVRNAIRSRFNSLGHQPIRSLLNAFKAANATALKPEHRAEFISCLQQL